jgi:hypothetical protein
VGLTFRVKVFRYSKSISGVTISRVRSLETHTIVILQGMISRQLHNQNVPINHSPIVIVNEVSEARRYGSKTTHLIVLVFPRKTVPVFLLKYPNSFEVLAEFWGKRSWIFLRASGITRTTPSTILPKMIVSRHCPTSFLSE